MDDFDRIARSDIAAGEDDRHDACAADEVAGVVAVEDGLHEAGLKIVELAAGVTQACDFDECGFAEAELGARWKRQDIEAARGDVFTHVARSDGEAAGVEFVM